MTSAYADKGKWCLKTLLLLTGPDKIFKSGTDAIMSADYNLLYSMYDNGIVDYDAVKEYQRVKKFGEGFELDETDKVNSLEHYVDLILEALGCDEPATTIVTDESELRDFIGMWGDKTPELIIKELGDNFGIFVNDVNENILDLAQRLKNSESHWLNGRNDMKSKEEFERGKYVDLIKEGKMKFELASTNKVNNLTSYIDIVLAAMGSPEALVTDESDIYDFVGFLNEPEEIEESLNELRTTLDIEIKDAYEKIVDLAQKIKDKYE